MELQEYLKPLRKWWWLLLASTLVATISSLIASLQEPPIYRAQSSLIIGRTIENPNPDGSDFWLGQQLAQTYVSLAQREPVRAATMERLGLTWLPEYTVRQVPNTLLVEVSVVDTSPERAAAVANEIANQLILRSPTAEQDSNSARQAFIDQQLNDLELQIDATRTEIADRQAALGEMFSARQIADTETQIAALQNKLSTLQSNYAGLLANTSRGAINTLSIVEAARVPGAPVGPNRLATVAAAAAIGFLLAAGAAYLLEYLDNTVKTPDDVSKAAGLTTLAGIMRIEAAEEHEKLIALNSPRSSIAEAYRALRTGVQYSVVDGNSRTLAITSANPGEGKTTTAANLATVFAEAGKRVLLIDADQRRPRLHRIFRLSGQMGLSTLFIRYEQEEPEELRSGLLDEVIQRTEHPNLDLLAAGPLPPNPSELLGSTKMQALIEHLEQRYDLLLFDTPPVLAVTDAVVLGTRVDNVLLVAQVQMTRVEALKAASDVLREAGVNLIGCVLNLLPTSGSGYYYSYYYYYRSYNYAYGYGDNSDDGDQSGSTGDKGERSRHRKRRRDRTPLRRVLDWVRPAASTKSGGSAP